MDSAFASGWQAYALTGRPDFLNYLRARLVTWDDLWDFYRVSPAEADAMVRLMGLFHAFQSVDFDREGGVLHRDSSAYAALRNWARFAVDCEEFLPEAKLCESLAGLLSQSLISPLYYEALFGVCLEQRLERNRERNFAEEIRHPAIGVGKSREESGRRLAVRLPVNVAEAPPTQLSLEGLLQRHYAPWNHAFATALGDDNEEWIEDGGEG